MLIHGFEHKMKRYDANKNLVLGKLFGLYINFGQFSTFIQFYILIVRSACLPPSL